MRNAAHLVGHVRRGAVAAGLMLLILLLPLSARAQEEMDLIESETQRLIENMDIGQIQEQAPALDVAKLLKEAATGEVPLDGEALGEALKHLVLGSLTELLPQMIRIVGVTVLCAALMQLRSVTGSDALTQMVETLAYLTLVLPAAHGFASLLMQGRTVTQNMTDFYQTVLPTMLSLLAAAGGAHSAAVMQEISLTATGLLTRFLQNTLFALLGFSAVVAILRGFAPQIKLERLLKLLNTSIRWALGICFTIFLGLLVMQGATSAHYDGIALRAAKYAIDKFVPVVGGVFKDTADTLIGCTIIVKNALGVVGLLGLCCIILEPLTGILCTIAAYRLCAAALEPLGPTRMVFALCDFADILTTLFILIISVAAMFFVFLAALMRIGMGYV